MGNAGSKNLHTESKINIMVHKAENDSFFSNHDNEQSSPDKAQRNFINAKVKGSGKYM